MKVIAIVILYNGSKWIDKCFGSLINSTIPLYILAIDNASTDGSPQIIKEKYPLVDVIEAGENLGFGKANNIGMQKAIDDNADYVFLLNQDAWIEPDTIAKLIKVQSKNPEYGIISPMHFGGDEITLDLLFSYCLSPVRCKSFISDAFNNKVNELYDVPFVNAAAWLISIECINSVGGFDPLFKHYGEDDDYINRLKYHGFKLGVVTSAKIYHDRPQNDKKNSSFHQQLVSYLIKFKNVNNGYRKIIINNFKYLLFHLANRLIFLDFQNFKRGSKILVLLINNLVKIKKHRKISAAKGTSFLLE